MIIDKVLKWDSMGGKCCFYSNRIFIWNIFLCNCWDINVWI